MAWRSLIKVVVAGAEAVGKAFARAVREEIKSKNEFSPEQMNLSIYGTQIVYTHELDAKLLKIVLAGQQAAAARSASQGSSEKETKQSAATNSRHGISVQVHLLSRGVLSFECHFSLFLISGGHAGIESQRPIEFRGSLEKLRPFVFSE